MQIRGGKKTNKLGTQFSCCHKGVDPVPSLTDNDSDAQINELNSPRQIAKLVGEQKPKYPTPKFTVFPCAGPSSTDVLSNSFLTLVVGISSSGCRSAFMVFKSHSQESSSLTLLVNRRIYFLRSVKSVRPVSYRPSTQRTNPGRLVLVVWTFWGLCYRIWSEGKEERDQNSSPVWGSTST